MKNLELNSEFNLLGQIDLNSVKIALDRDEMEEIVGGYGGRNCFFMGLGLFACAAAMGLGGGWGMVAGGGAMGGYFTAASSGCF